MYYVNIVEDRESLVTESHPGVTVSHPPVTESHPNSINLTQTNNSTSKEVQQSWTFQEEEKKTKKKKPTQLSVKKEAPPQLPATPPMKGRPDIQELIYEIKKKCDQLGLAYESDKDTYFAKHILDAKEFGSFAEKIGKTRVQMAISIVSASVQINYWKWATAWPRRIYKEYQEIYNLRITKFKKESEKKPLNSIWKLC